MVRTFAKSVPGSAPRLHLTISGGPSLYAKVSTQGTAKGKFGQVGENFSSFDTARHKQRRTELIVLTCRGRAITGQFLHLTNRIGSRHCMRAREAVRGSACTKAFSMAAGPIGGLSLNSVCNIFSSRNLSKVGEAAHGALGSAAAPAAEAVAFYL